MLCAFRASCYGRAAEVDEKAAGGGQFFFTSDVCNEIVRTLSRLHPESIVDAVAGGEALTPTGASGSLDPSDSFVLAKAYCFTQNRKFLDRLVEVVEACESSTHDSSYEEEMIRRAACTFSDVFAFHVLSPEEHRARAVLFRAVETQCRRLCRTRQKARPLTRVMAAGAVALTALAFAGLRRAEAWKEWGLSTLCELMSEYIYPARPMSLGERYLAAETYLSLVILSQRNNVDVPCHVLGGVEAILEGIEEFPEVGVPHGNERILDIVPFDSACSREAILALGSILFDRPEFEGANPGVGETLVWLLGVGGLEEYEAVQAAAQDGETRFLQGAQSEAEPSDELCGSASSRS